MPLLHADAEDWWLKGEDFPNLVTAFSMDAPTEKQFDVPVQQRKARDVVKALDTAKRWSSKITGLMIAGVGMLAFVTRAGLGAGADLSCTVLYSALMHMVKLNRPLGQKLHVLLDNTVAENKCNTMIFFLAWLVQLNVFTEASFFCMMVGHTYSRIDQTFRTLIGYMMARAIWTVEDMVTAIAQYLGVYDCLGCIELHCMWAWKDWFKPHVYSEFGNFATSTCTHAPSRGT